MANFISLDPHSSVMQYLWVDIGCFSFICGKIHLNKKIHQTGPLTDLINYVHDRGICEGGDGDNFGVFSCGENDGENDGENTVKLL